MTGPVLSVSQVEKFDHQQEGGCQRKWWFEVVQGLKPEMTVAQSDGDIGHEHLARYLTTGEKPKGRVKMGKAVTGAILKGELPEPGPHLLVEKRFDGQNKRDENGNWIPVDLAKTLHLAGLPWDGFIDLRYRSDDGLVHVVDHKFSSDPDTYAKPADELIKTVQLPVYVLDSLRLWPDADRFRIAHHYVSKRGVHSFFREAVVGRSEIEERKADIERVVAELQQVRAVEKQDDVPFSRRACTAFSGCPHQSICKAFKENQMSVSAEEMALFDGLEDLAPASAPPVKDRVPGEDDGDPTPAVAVDELEALFGPDAKAARDPRPSEAEVEAHLAAIDEDVAPVPVASKPAEQTPACDDCGTELNAENGSQLRSGEWVHPGCPAQTAGLPLLEQKKPEAPAVEEVWALAEAPPVVAEEPKKQKEKKAEVKVEKKPAEPKMRVVAVSSGTAISAPAEEEDDLSALGALKQRVAAVEAVTESVRESSLTPEAVSQLVAQGFTIRVEVSLGAATLALLERLVTR